MERASPAGLDQLDMLLVTFIGYAPVMSGGYEGIEVSYDIPTQDPTITNAQYAIASKEIVE